MQVPGKELLMVVLKVMGDSEPRSPERETEDRCKAAEIRYLRNLLLRVDRGSTGTIKPVPGKLTDGKAEKALTENMGEQEAHEGKKQTQEGSREKTPGCILALLEGSSVFKEGVSLLPEWQSR